MHIVFNYSHVKFILKFLLDFIAPTSRCSHTTHTQAIINVLNCADLNFSSALSRLINEYNMKPVLTRPQHRFFTDGATYFEIDVDVHTFGYVARKGLSMLRYAYMYIYIYIRCGLLKYIYIYIFGIFV